MTQVGRGVRPGTFDVVLGAYGLMVLLGRFFGERAATVPWEVALTGVIGIAWGLQPIGPPGQKVALTPASLVAFPVILAMALVAHRLFVLLPSIAGVTYGVRGLVNGRITFSGRVGRGREYTGVAAYLHSAFCIFSGAVLATACFLFPGFWEP